MSDYQGRSERHLEGMFQVGAPIGVIAIIGVILALLAGLLSVV